MKHLKKIFKTKNDSWTRQDELDIETVKSLTNDFTDEFSIDVDIKDICFGRYKDLPEYRTDWEYLENYEGDDIHGCGYGIKIPLYLEQISHIDDSLKNCKILNNILLIGKRINDNFGSKVYIAQDENEVVVIIHKNIPSKHDYYHILMNELKTYRSESDYLDIVLEEKSSDFYIIFKSERSNPVIQKQYLKYFMENVFQEITYDEVIIIDNNSLKLKNPKCDFIKFKI